MGSKADMHTRIKANFIGLKYNFSWQDRDKCSKVVVINVITNLVLKQSMMFDEEYLLQVVQL